MNAYIFSLNIKVIKIYMDFMPLVSVKEIEQTGMTFANSFSFSSSLFF